MNGSCTNVCPVKINIHEQIFAWRKVLAEEHQIPLLKQGMMKAAGAVLSRPAAYRAAIQTADSALRVLPRFAVYNPANTWGKKREMPHAPRQSFHAWYRQNRMKKGGDA